MSFHLFFYYWCCTDKVSKKLAVLGATGQTGQCVVQQALEHGHVVVAIVRNPQKMKISHNNLKVQ